jgi:hypothetical protein
MTDNYAFADEKSCKRMNKRYRELAGIFKETKLGDYEEYCRIVSKFALQEGLKESTAQEYAETLLNANLVVMKDGASDWYYNEEAEWDLFKINI